MQQKSVLTTFKRSMGCPILKYHTNSLSDSFKTTVFPHLSIHRKRDSELRNYVKLYTYGFQGQEKDDEIKGSGNSYTTEFRQYDSRLGRWLSTDPISHPQFSPYSAFDNNPIYFKDPSGANSEESESADDGGKEPKKLEGYQLEALLDPNAEPETKFTVLKDIKDGSYELNNADLKDIIKNSESSFIKNNKSELLKINSVSLEEGKLGIDLKSGTDNITLITGDEFDLSISDNATADFSGLNISNDLFVGAQSSEASNERAETALSVDGNVSFSGFSAKYILVSIPIRSISYSSKVKSNIFSLTTLSLYDNLVTTATIVTKSITYSQIAMYQWIPYKAKKE